MAIQPQTARRFERSSPVARYWLAQCEGFRVKGPLRGTVEQVVGSVDPQSAEALIVRSRGQRRKVPVASVDVVVPAARLIVVEGRRSDSELTRRARGLVRASSRAARAAAQTVARVAPPVGQRGVHLARSFALLVFVGLLTLGRVLLLVSLRAVEVAQAQWLGAAERRRRAARR